MYTTPQDHGEPNRKQRPAPTLCLLFSNGTPVSPEDAPPILLRPGSLLIGRQVPEPGLALPKDDLVSKKHAELQIDADDRVTLHDRGSVNGTFLNSFRIAEGRALQDGDVIRVGGSLLLLRYDSDPLCDDEVHELVGRSPAIRALRRTLLQAAKHDAPVLLLGETGSGKEVAAAALHRLSVARRRAKAPDPTKFTVPPFIAINCAAIVDTLAESMLFGHDKGAFTGAEKQKGYLPAADGGTLFLDEIGELPQALQPKLLRAFDSKGEVIRVGQTNPVRSSFRLIAATHRDIQTAATAGSFRNDLFARLDGQKITLPPLRERREDVLMLLAHLARPEELPPLTHLLAEALVCAPWPRNVRQLLQLAKRLPSFPERPLSLAQLSSAFLEPAPAGAARVGPPSITDVLAALASTGNDQTRAAAQLGISRFAVYRILRKARTKS